MLKRRECTILHLVHEAAFAGALKRWMADGGAP